MVNTEPGPSEPPKSNRKADAGQSCLRIRGVGRNDEENRLQQEGWGERSINENVDNKTLLCIHQSS